MSLNGDGLYNNNYIQQINPQQPQQHQQFITRPNFPAISTDNPHLNLTTVNNNNNNNVAPGNSSSSIHRLISGSLYGNNSMGNKENNNNYHTPTYPNLNQPNPNFINGQQNSPFLPLSTQHHNNTHNNADAVLSTGNTRRYGVVPGPTINVGPPPFPRHNLPHLAVPNNNNNHNQNNNNNNNNNQNNHTTPTNTNSVNNPNAPLTAAQRLASLLYPPGTAIPNNNSALSGNNNNNNNKNLNNNNNTDTSSLNISSRGSLLGGDTLSNSNGNHHISQMDPPTIVHNNPGPSTSASMQRLLQPQQHHHLINHQPVPAVSGAFRAVPGNTPFDGLSRNSGTQQRKNMGLLGINPNPPFGLSNNLNNNNPNNNHNNNNNNIIMHHNNVNPNNNNNNNNLSSHNNHNNNNNPQTPSPFGIGPAPALSTNIRLSNNTMFQMNPNPNSGGLLSINSHHNNNNPNLSQQQGHAVANNNNNHKSSQHHHNHQIMPTHTIPYNNPQNLLSTGGGAPRNTSNTSTTNQNKDNNNNNNNNINPVPSGNIPATSTAFFTPAPIPTTLFPPNNQTPNNVMNPLIQPLTAGAAPKPGITKPLPLPHQPPVKPQSSVQQPPPPTQQIQQVSTNAPYANGIAMQFNLQKSPVMETTTLLQPALSGAANQQQQKPNALIPSFLVQNTSAALDNLFLRQTSDMSSPLQQQNQTTAARPLDDPTMPQMNKLITPDPNYIAQLGINTPNILIKRHRPFEDNEGFEEISQERLQQQHMQHKAVLYTVTDYQPPPPKKSVRRKPTNSSTNNNNNNNNNNLSMDDSNANDISNIDITPSGTTATTTAQQQNSNTSSLDEVNDVTGQQQTEVGSNATTAKTTKAATKKPKATKTTAQPKGASKPVEPTTLAVNGGSSTTSAGVTLAPSNYAFDQDDYVFLFRQVIIFKIDHTSKYFASRDKITHELTNLINERLEAKNKELQQQQKDGVVFEEAVAGTEYVAGTLDPNGQVILHSPVTKQDVEYKVKRWLLHLSNKIKAYHEEGRLPYSEDGKARKVNFKNGGVIFTSRVTTSDGQEHDLNQYFLTIYNHRHPSFD